MKRRKRRKIYPKKIEGLPCFSLDLPIIKGLPDWSGIVSNEQLLLPMDFIALAPKARKCTVFTSNKRIYENCSNSLYKNYGCIVRVNSMLGIKKGVAITENDNLVDFEIEDYCRGLAEKYGLEIYGSYDARSLGLAFEDFWDSYHMKPESIDKILPTV